MKSVLICILMLVIPGVGLAGRDVPFRQAILQGAKAKVVFRVVDDEGMPVSGATVHVWFSSDGRPQDDADWVVETDKNGVFVASHRTNEQLSWLVSKDGYYRTHGKILFRGRKIEGPRVVDGKWQPYGETRTVVLKRILNPIDIGGFGRCSIPIPAHDEWVGFDFEKREWTPPYGQGKYSDVLLKFGRELVHPQTDFKMTMEVSFTNNQYAGYCLMKEDEFSERRNVYLADTNAIFKTGMSYIHERHPNSPRIDNRIGRDSYLIFRTRTKVDEKGKLVSAHYGIIGGPWSFFDTMLSSGYLFNPTPNDTNLEDAETARLSRLGYKQQLEFERRRKAGK